MNRLELEDFIAEAIDNSMGPDWNSHLGARYVIDALVEDRLLNPLAVSRDLAVGKEQG